MISNLETLHQEFSGCDSAKQSARSYTKREAEQLTKLDARRMKPDLLKYPESEMLTCQLGRRAGTGENQTFRLIAFGRTWAEALEMLS